MYAQLKYLVLISLALSLCACGTGPSRSETPSPGNQAFQAAPDFLDTVVKLDGEERSQCIEDLMVLIADQIGKSGTQDVAKILDSKLTIEINETCQIKRK